jgi:hypothetical protein
MGHAIEFRPEKRKSAAIYLSAHTHLLTQIRGVRFPVKSKAQASGKTPGRRSFRAEAQNGFRVVVLCT